MAHISEAAPLQISRFYTGLYTYRNPLIVPIRQMGRRIIELYDAISDGLNMECSNRLTLVRRPGYTTLSSYTDPVSFPGQIFKYFYTFKPSSFAGQIYQLADTTDGVWQFRPDGDVTDTWTALFSKQSAALTNFSTVGAYCYMAQEITANKWDGPSGAQGVTRWGIDMYNRGWTQTRSPVGSSNLPGTGVPWGERGATLIGVTLNRPAGNLETITSEWNLFYQFGFNFTAFPSFEVSGIRVSFNIVGTLEGAVTSPGTSLNVRLLRTPSNFYGTTRTVTLPSTVGAVGVGSPSDLWDGAWTINDINQLAFGVGIQAVNSSAPTGDFTITNVSITVYLNTGPVVGAAPAGTPAPVRTPPQVGYFYKYCYGNSHSGHLSSPTPPSFYSVPDGLINPGASAVQIGLNASDDVQVTDIHVFRTTDGGGNPYFELPNSPFPNADASIIDPADDTQLQIANVCPDPHFNDPPPGGAIDPVWFAGRLWLHRGNQLFFSSGPDITMGNEAEAWYPVYVFAVPDQIIRKFPTPNGMLVVCVDTILIVRGISTASFTVNDFMKDTGMRVWTAGDSDGTNIYLYTSDRQLLLINANGLSAVASSIADRIAVVDPTKAYLCQYRYGSFENLLFVGDGSTTLYPFNVELQAWNTPQQPVGGVGAIATIERSPGVYQFWRAKPVALSTVSFRDLTVWADEGTAYPCNVIFGPIPVADFLTLAQMRDIVLTTASTTTQITLSVLANEIFPVAGSQFQILQISSSEPPELSATPSLSYTSNRYTWKSAPLPEVVNLYFKRIDFSADPNPDELYLWTAGGTQTTGGSSLGAPGQLPQLQGR